MYLGKDLNISSVTQCNWISSTSRDLSTTASWATKLRYSLSDNNSQPYFWCLRNSHYRAQTWYAGLSLSIPFSYIYLDILAIQHSLGRISLTTDMWSDTNLSPFMAVTAHWIEGKTENTINGPRRVLKLRSDLIGFLRVPGHHTGEHLAHALLHITDRVGITDKVAI